jgi:micrococcal nuclease
MKKLLLLILVIILLGSWIIVGKAELSGKAVNDIKSDFVEKGFVTRVIDGDTVVIRGESVRLLGIDTDERGGDCYKEAKEKLEELVLNKEVDLETDLRDKDQYKRYLRFLFFDGENINLKMVEEGLAIARFYDDEKYREEILDAEESAMMRKVGCKWGDL